MRASNESDTLRERHDENKRMYKNEPTNFILIQVGNKFFFSSQLMKVKKNTFSSTDVVLIFVFCWS